MKWIEYGDKIIKMKITIKNKSIKEKKNLKKMLVLSYLCVLLYKYLFFKKVAVLSEETYNIDKQVMPLASSYYFSCVDMLF